MSWSKIEAEARADGGFVGAGRFPLRAYSEFMPPPWVGCKPYDLAFAARPETSATFSITDDSALDITEYERAHELQPGLAKIAGHLLTELARLHRGQAHALSRTLLDGKPAWPAELAAAAAAGRLRDESIVLLAPLALSRTQDDKGNVRWTLFGASHDGAQPFWRSVPDEATLTRLVRFARGAADGDLAGVRVHGDGELPAFAQKMLVTDGDNGRDADCLITFTPFAALPAWARERYLARTLILLPTPASLVLYHHPRYRQLAHELDHARQIPLLHLFPRVQGGYRIRIPQSGWFVEPRPGQSRAEAEAQNPHAVVADIARSHRWERVARDSSEPHTDDALHKMAIALFSTDPDHLGLYGKPMARNAQLWSDHYRLLVDGPNADAKAIEQARQTIAAGGRFGYRFVYPAMRAGARELYWHYPLVARLASGGEVRVMDDPALLGYVTAEATGRAPLVLAPRFCERPGHRVAATQFADAGRARFTTANNVRKILEFAGYLGGTISPSLARRLLHIAKSSSLADWLAHLSATAADPHAAAELTPLLQSVIRASDDDFGPARTFDQTATRAFAEEVWRSIAGLAEGEFRAKETADALARR